MSQTIHKHYLYQPISPEKPARPSRETDMPSRPILTSAHIERPVYKGKWWNPFVNRVFGPDRLEKTMSVSLRRRPGTPGAINWYVARAWGPLGNLVTDFWNFHFKSDFFRKIDFFDLAWSDFGTGATRSVWTAELSWNLPRNPRPQKNNFSKNTFCIGNIFKNELPTLPELGERSINVRQANSYPTGQLILPEDN